MPNSLMYEEDNFVVLETNQPEQFLTASELQQKLMRVIKEIKFEDLPRELQHFDSTQAQVKYLIDTTCELNLNPGEYLQWYAVRLEK